ncbi:hypothetical protein IPV08_23475 [Methylobacterium sp. SD274]|uniref:hypothetical protein n=1 Tax=Methylobacterium sp. SD274 TaxID=2782009 RepID=UPI001A9776D9|nr:hypothetical protein [Methylobacterium sp. SD274]MBO1022922.1 hypothetical protein [Methylobacterium sp. SD274]
MPSYYFPILWINPDFHEEISGRDGIFVHKRKWVVDIIDLYSLSAGKHPLKVRVELMNVFLEQVNLEVEIQSDDYIKAKESLDVFRAMIYLRGVKPTISPFASNISLNKYAGINNRSAGLKHKLLEGMREGITHDTFKVETWPNELAFTYINRDNNYDDLRLNGVMIDHSIENIKIWEEIERKQSNVRAARRAFVKAPLMPDMQSSILLIWQGIESLFPNVQAEISFRISLLISELISSISVKGETYKKCRASYNDRSKIAHGSLKVSQIEQWASAWSILNDCLQAILLRRKMPSEEEIIQELLHHDLDVDDV